MNSTGKTWNLHAPDAFSLCDTATLITAHYPSSCEGRESLRITLQTRQRFQSKPATHYDTESSTKNTQNDLGFESLVLLTKRTWNRSEICFRHDQLRATMLSYT